MAALSNVGDVGVVAGVDGVVVVVERGRAVAAVVKAAWVVLIVWQP